MDTKKTLTEAQERWVAALESGNYKQGHTHLRQDDYYCCLGIACEVFREELGLRVDRDRDGCTRYNHQSVYLPYKVVQHLRLRPGAALVGPLRPEFQPVEQVLAGLNDSGNYDFLAIAGFIRDNAERIFR